MYLNGSRIADFLITAITVATQILIGRLFFREWKKRIPAFAAPAVTIILGVMWSMFLFASVSRFGRFAWMMRGIPLSVRTWVIAAGNLWGLPAVVSFVIYLLYRRLVSRSAPLHSPQRRALIQAAGVVAVTAPFAVAAFGAIVERFDFHVKEVDLPVPNLHPDLVGFRIGQLSDLHVSPWLSVRDAARAVDMLNELKPHLTVVTGDVITQPGDPLDGAILELGRLRADAGVLGCLGNHERFVRCEDYETREAAKYGIGILRNQSRLLRWGNGLLNVSGVDYQSHRDGEYLPDAEKLVLPGAANLLLSHNPDVFPVAVQKGFDAVMSGHTHGGQVTVEILNQTLNLARFATPYVAGLYRLQGRSCYVTAGLGTIAVPVRIGAPPEITVVRLVSAKGAVSSRHTEKNSSVAVARARPVLRESLKSA
jgi:predicted MPP superfamily phosphohydrolase